MKKCPWFWFVIVIFVPGFLCSQDIVVYDSIYEAPLPQVNVGGIEVGQCSHTNLGEETLIRVLFDILVTKEGKEYAYGITQTFHDTTMMLNNFPGGGLIEFFDYIIEDKNKKGWTCDENGYSYSVGQGVTKKELTLNVAQEDYIGDLPLDMNCQGGLTYRKGKFYLHSINNQLVEVNMKDPSKSQVVMDFPPGTLPIDGLATVQLGCDSVVTYAIGRTPEISKVYEIDFSNWTLTELCEVPISITGAGSQTECMLPPCDIIIDLDNDNSSFAFRGDFCADTFCVPPVMVSDTDVVIVSAFDSISSIFLELNGILDIGQEYLSISAANNINIIGNNTLQLVMENNGSATINDFEQAIENVVYNNVSPAITFGRRTVMVTAFAGGESSLVSVTELPLSNEQMVTLAMVAEPTCYGFDNGSISLSSSGGIPPYTYQWQIPQQGSLVDNLPAGFYPYLTVDSIGCSRLGMAILNQPDTLIVGISYDGHPSICDLSGYLEATASGGSGLLEYQWDNGIVGSVNSGLGPGTYELSVEDTNGCMANASFTILQGDTLLAIESGQVCEGEVYTWNNGTYVSDTLACQVYTMENGCDSTVCLSLSVLPAPDVLLTADGDLCSSTEVNISAGTFDSYLWSTGETAPEITVGSPYEYGVTISDSFGCTGSATISLAPPIEFGIVTNKPSCFDAMDGSISFINASGGVPPLMYSIDGGINLVAETVFDGVSAGNYQLVVEGSEGCRVDSFIQIQSPPEIIIDAGADQSITLGDTVSLAATTNLLSPNVLWSPAFDIGCPTCLITFAIPISTTFYEVEVVDTNGCTALDGVNIIVDDESDIYFPTAFSPNGDRINDFFTAYSDGSIKEVISMEVFDRWGSLVFEKRNFPPNIENQGWDGQTMDGYVQTGLFVFKAELLKIDGQTEIVYGEFSLLR